MGLLGDGGVFGSGASKSSTSSASSTLGAQTQQGSPANINISAGHDIGKNAQFNTTVNNQYVDAGAFELASDTVGAALDTAKAAAADSARLRDLAVQQAGEAVRQAYDFAGDLVDQVTGTQTQAVIQATNVADDVANRTFDLAEHNQDFLGAVLDSQQSFAEGVLQQISDQAFSAGDRLIDATSAVLSRESTNTEGRLEEITQRSQLVFGVVAGVALLVAGYALVHR